MPVPISRMSSESDDQSEPGWEPEELLTEPSGSNTSSERLPPSLADDPVDLELFDELSCMAAAGSTSSSSSVAGGRELDCQVVPPLQTGSPAHLRHPWLHPSPFQSLAPMTPGLQWSCCLHPSQTPPYLFLPARLLFRPRLLAPRAPVCLPPRRHPEAGFQETAEVTPREEIEQLACLQMPPARPCPLPRPLLLFQLHPPRLLPRPARMPWWKLVP
jgi:hypothetical protein